MAEWIADLTVACPPELIGDLEFYLRSRIKRALPPLICIVDFEMEYRTANRLRWRIVTKFRKIIVQEQGASIHFQVRMHEPFTVLGHLLEDFSGTKRLYVKGDRLNAAPIADKQVRYDTSLNLRCLAHGPAPSCQPFIYSTKKVIGWLDLLIVLSDILVLAKTRFDLLVEQVAHVVGRLQALDHDHQLRLVG